MKPTFPPDPESISNVQLYLLLRDMHMKLTSVTKQLAALEQEQRDRIRGNFDKNLPCNFDSNLLLIFI